MPKANEKTARNVAMAAMRREGYTYPEIAAHFSITHQRVAQVLGPARYRASPNDRLLSSANINDTDNKIADTLGVSSYVVRQYRKRHGIHTHGPGSWAETLVAGILASMGLSPTLHNHRHSHDITVGTLRIDVKECRKSKNYTNHREGWRGSPQVKFQTRGPNKRKNCDVYVLVVSDPSCPGVFVVPASAVPKAQEQIVFSWPRVGTRGPKSPWREYRGRWDIIANDPQAATQGIE